MKVVYEENAKRMERNKVNYNVVYDFEDNDINIGIARIYGRFPETGYVRNKECKEIIYALEGHGAIYFEDIIYEFRSGDAILIEKNEKYYVEGNCKLLLPCTPAWNEEQHEMIESDVK